MYHELGLPGRPPCQSEPAYLRYIVSAADFESQIHWLRNIGWRGMSVTEALSSPHENGVVVTFDDGCETDLLSAAPILNGARFGATFYITVGFLGKRGCLSHDQLRELSDQGFDIGCHSKSHRHLSDLTREQLHMEIAKTKEEIEQIIGLPVLHFSCPGGRYDSRVVEIAKQAGYSSVATSRPCANSWKSNPYALGRVAITRGTTPITFQRLCRAQGLWLLQSKDTARSAAKHLFGNTAYDRIRDILLKH